ncbi:hypothetical protein SF274771_1080 [Shigella flexneri 2747-71]|nr:hypothetical protein SF274771_1080 [Shigella flexneri 2747-71]
MKVLPPSVMTLIWRECKFCGNIWRKNSLFWLTGKYETEAR